MGKTKELDSVLNEQWSYPKGGGFDPVFDFNP